MMEIAVQKLAILSLFCIGLSHILQPKSWAVFFVYLHGKGKQGSFINGFIHFPLGALIVAFHNVWSGIPLILTLLGYGWVLKSFVYFLVPAVGVRLMARVSIEKPNGFIVAGIAMVLLAGLLLFSLISGI